MLEPPPPAIPRPPRRLVGSMGAAAAIALALFVAFNANLRSINARDTRVMQLTGLAVAATGTPDLSPYPDLVASGVASGSIRIVDGRPRSTYPLLPSLLAVPAYRLALSLGAIDPDAPAPARVEAVGKIVASGCVAAACGLLYLLLTTWRPAAPALVIALACGLATPLWSSASQALWSHGPAALCLTLALGGALAVPRTSRWRPPVLVACGVFVVLAVFCRQLLAVFPLGLAAGLWRSAEPRRHLALFLGGAALAVVGVAAVNLEMLGTPAGGAAFLYTAGVNAGTHGVSNAWSGAWVSGLAGVLVSPSRGVLIYMPIALLAVAGAGVAWRDGGLARYGLALPTALYVALWAKYAVWWGGHSYGPRIAADVAVPLALLAAGAIAPWASTRAFTRIAILIALIWSIGVQAIGAFCYPAGEWNGSPRDVDHAHERLWDWRDTQLQRTISAGPYRH